MIRKVRSAEVGTFIYPNSEIVVDSVVVKAIMVNDPVIGGQKCIQTAD